MVTLWEWNGPSGTVPPAPWALAVDATDVYWTTMQKTDGVDPVMKCPIDGCGGAPFTVLPTQPTIFGVNTVAVDATAVYFTSQGSGASVMTCPKSGCTADPTVLASGQSYPVAITVDATNVYWANNGVAGQNGSVMMCAIGGCNDSPTTLASAQDGPTGIVVDATNVYWTNYGNGTASPGSVMKCAIAGCGGTPTVVASGQQPVGLALAGTTIFWENSFTTAYPVDEIVSSDVGGGSTTVVASGFPSGSTGHHPWGGIAADDTTVYWAFGGVWTVPAAGGNATEVPESGVDAVRIVVDATSVYWTDEAGNRVVKLTPK